MKRAYREHLINIVRIVSYRATKKNCERFTFPFMGRVSSGVASRDVMQRRLAIN